MKLSPSGAPTSSSSPRIRPCGGALRQSLNMHPAPARQHTATHSTTPILLTDDALATVKQTPLAWQAGPPTLRTACTATVHASPEPEHARQHRACFVLSKAFQLATHIAARMAEHCQCGKLAR